MGESVSEPKKLTERQRFERWLKRTEPWMLSHKSDLWAAWQASARAKR